MPVDLRTQLATIEQRLRPAHLPQKVRAIVFSTRHHGIGFDDFEDDAGDDFVTRRKRTLDLIRSLGVATANDDQALTELLPEIVSSDGYLGLFGAGVHEGAAAPVGLWNRLVAAYAATDEGQRRPHVLGGFLQGLHAANLSIAENLLDQSLEHGVLAPIYPFLQAAVPIDQKGVARLNRSLALGKTPIRMYTHLRTGGIPAAELKRLLLAIAEHRDGYDVAIEILVTRVHLANSQKQVVAPELLTAGCELLQRLTFTKQDSRDYDLGAIATVCLTGELGAAVARELCGRLKTEAAAYRTYSHNYQFLLCGLFRVQPLAALDALCGGSAEELHRGARILRECRHHENPISLIADQDLIRWCEHEPQTRFVALAQAITSFSSAKDGAVAWTSIGLRFLEHAPDPAAVLSHFVAQFKPSSGWSGTLTSILESNSKLLNQLDAFPALQPHIEQEKARLRQRINDERARETERERNEHERFE